MKYGDKIIKMEGINVEVHDEGVESTSKDDLDTCWFR